MMELVGKTHTFDDGDSIKVSQIKERDGNEMWVTYLIQQGPGIPRKLLMPLHEFVNIYGHLFGISEDTFRGESE